MRRNLTRAGFSALTLVLGVAAIPCAQAANQTATVSPVVIGGTLPFSTQIQNSISFPGVTLPSLQSFARAEYGGQWLLMGGLSGGQHNLGSTGFLPQFNNSDVYVIDPVTQQVWSRSLATDPTSGLTQAQIDSLKASNMQFTQQGSHLYIAGGYGPIAGPGPTSLYQTFDTLTAVDLPGLMNWVKEGAATAADSLRQISDPMFQVTGGEMMTTSNGKTHLIFGQNYPTAYKGGITGTYTNQVRSFTIVDNGLVGGLSVAGAVAGTPQADFRRRDLNVVPIIQNVNGQLVDKVQALAGVFTTSNGAWTVPVTIDADGNATESDPTAASTFKQGMNSYRSASIGLYSASTNTMHTLLLGGISYEYYDAAAGQIKTDVNLPYISDSTDIVTDGNGVMTQYLLSTAFPTILSDTGKTLLLGTETEFFLKDGIATYSNGVIDLDALTGPTLVGYLFGGIASDAPNLGTSVASNAMFPVIITPQGVPEPATLAVGAVAALTLLTRRRQPGFAGQKRPG